MTVSIRHWLPNCAPLLRVATKTVRARVTPMHLLRRSHALASMFPSLLLSGVITLAVTAVVCVMWIGTDNDFFGAWMEAWLTSWPIAFPLTYLLNVVLRRLALPMSPA